MSYLDSPRLHFRGWFQADVSTINNDIRFYQNASFVPEYQVLNENASWNPEGTAVYRFLDCSATGGVLRGRPADVSGITVQNAVQRAPGKLVDLDPQQQMVSEIWGMQVRLVAASGQTLVQGDFVPAPFMNLWKRQQKAALRDQTLTAYYQSVLENVTWFDLSGSPLLQALQNETEDGQLSIAFSCFGFGRDNTIPRYTMGHLVGTIGPYYHGEPKFFTRGRQLIADMSNFPVPAHELGSAEGKLSSDGGSLTLDFGNSFPLESADSGLSDIGPIFVGVLTSGPASILSTVDAGQVIILGEVPYATADWYTQTAGVQTFDLTNNDAAKGKLGDQPIVVLSPAATAGSYNVLLQESLGGVYVRADQFVYRMDSGDSSEVEFYADRYGVPLPNATIQLQVITGFMGGSGGGPAPIQPPFQPAAAVACINYPENVVSFPASVQTDSNGYARVNLCASPEGPGAPRGYILHQLYGIGYQLAEQPAGYIPNPMNYLSVLVFTRKDVPATPTWYADIQPLFVQYANLYPIMSRYVVDLRDYESVCRRRQILQLAFSLPIGDPNHMPVTRDLSRGDRETILKWLSMEDETGLLPLGTPSQSPAVPQPACIDAAATNTPVEAGPGQTAGKSAFLLALAASRKQGGGESGGTR